MANWCSDSVVFTGNLNNLIQLQKDFDQALKTIDEGDSHWIGRLLCYKDVDYNNIRCRSFVDNWSTLEEVKTSKQFILETQSAWGPVVEMYNWMAETYDLTYVIWAEEAGNEVFINTDKTGEFFSTRYYVSYYEGLDNCYFDTLDEVVEVLQEELKLPATSKMTLDELNELDDDVCIYEFETTC